MDTDDVVIVIAGNDKVDVETVRFRCDACAHVREKAGLIQLPESISFRGDAESIAGFQSSGGNFFGNGMAGGVDNANSGDSLALK